MTPVFRTYNHDIDYARVGEFLVKTHDAADSHVNWLQPRWEYMHYHPLIWDVDLDAIGVWEAEGRVVGVVHPEHAMGTAYIEVGPGCAALKEEMLAYAEEHISTIANGKESLSVYINDRDEAFQALAAEMGYARTDSTEPMAHLVVPSPFPTIALPDGFRLKSLAEDNDDAKVHRLLFRGFNHGDEPPGPGVEARKFMQSAPNYRKDLNIVAEAPDGTFVSYCGMWYEPVNRIAYVEPVCTDPDYRRMGLASAAVLEGIRRCGELGATVAYVGATLPVYLSIGFRQIYNRTAWRREWT